MARTVSYLCHTHLLAKELGLNQLLTVAFKTDSNRSKHLRILSKTKQVALYRDLCAKLFLETPKSNRAWILERKGG